MTTIAITGASGFVGKNLESFFTSLNYKVIPLNRDSVNIKKLLLKKLENVDIIINLSGANIINRWTEEYKEELYTSRIETTKKIVQAIDELEKKPKLLISTSAVGIYDNKDTYDESGTYSNDFLSSLCQDWEEEALKARSDETKVTIFRFGIVLGKDGGALQKMKLPFKMGVGGVIGDGSQAFSFIHMQDLLEAYKFIIENNHEDIFNLCAPFPTTNKGLTLALGKTLKRPTILPLPKFVLKAIFSEGAQVLTDGQSAIPQKLTELGFDFKYQTIEETIDNLLK